MNAADPPIITLLTDFGESDPYVGSLRGVLLAACPSARIVDISHSVPPHDVSRADFLLAVAAPWFPDRTVHLAVVDPGVGGSRRALAWRSERHFFVGPDNGLFTTCLARAVQREIVAIDAARSVPRAPHPTFHGRDLFAPAAAALASGRSLTQLGPAVADPVTLSGRRPSRDARGRLALEVVHVDRFGNVVTSLDEECRDELPGEAPWSLELGAARRELPLVGTYVEAEPGAVVALWGSSGYLELSIACARAADELGVAAGDRIVIAPGPGARGPR